MKKKEKEPLIRDGHRIRLFIAAASVINLIVLFGFGYGVLPK